MRGRRRRKAVQELISISRHVKMTELLKKLHKNMVIVTQIITGG